MAAPEPAPLTGVRILDCSRVLAGPLAAMLLADLGADVIKLEPPNGDETRTWGPPFWGDPSDRRSAYFAAVNRNKRGIAVDLTTRGGSQILDRLAATSDVLVHNFRPATASRLGLGANRLRRRHPHLLVALVGGFPGDRRLPAYDLLAQAVSGLMSVTGSPDGEPVKVGVPLLDIVAGQNLAIGILAALLARPNPHREVEVHLIEVGVTALTNVLANYVASGVEQPRYGNAHPNIAPYQSFQATDGHVVIAVGNDAQFARLLATLGLEDRDSRYATNPRRVAQREALAEWLQAAIAKRSRDEVVSALAAADVPVGPVLAVGEAVAAMEDARDGAWLQELDGVRLAPNPIHLDGTTAPIRRLPPTIGQHTVEVLGEVGYGDGEVKRLYATGAIS